MQYTIKQITALDVWPIRHKVMWPNMPFDFIKLPQDSEGVHFGLFIADELTSVISLFETAKGVAQFRKFATITKAQGKGYGSILLQHLIDYVVSKKFNLLWCNSRINKTDYYKKFGMLETTEIFTKGNLKFMILKKVL